RPFPSQARWNLVVSPPRLRPSPSSVGSWTPFCVGPTRPTTGATGMLVGTGARAVDADFPDDLAYGIRAGLHMREYPVPGPIPPPAVEPVRAGLPVAVALGQVAPGRAGAQLPQ